MYKIEQQNEKRLDCLIEIEKHIPLSEDFSLAEYHLMQEYSNDEDETVRSMVARLLIDANSTEGEDILCRLAFDSSSLVRVEACDSLSAFCSLRAWETLAYVCKRDRNCMVKGYAVESLSKISWNLGKKAETKDIMCNMLKKKKSVFLTICLFKTMYELGEQEYLFELCKLLHTPNYRDRCAVISSLMEIADEDNRDFIINEIRSVYEYEKVRAVSEKEKEALDYLETYGVQM